MRQGFGGAGLRRRGIVRVVQVAAFALWPVAAALAGGAPDTQLTSVEPDPTNDPTGDFAFASTIPDSTFECSVDAAPFAPCTSAFSTAPLADGAHSFQVRARAPGGSVDPTPASHAWTVDTVRPDTTITSGPSGQITSDSAVFTFASTEPGGSFLCTRDGGAPFGCTSPTTLSNLAQGAHTFTVRAIDAASNADLTPASRSWTVDAIGPDTTITSGPTGATPSDDATFSFSASEAGSTFECSLDAAPFAGCASPVAFVDLPQGDHTFAVRAIDQAGNPDASPAQRAWTVDSVAPETTIDSGPPAFSNSTSATFTFSANEAGATFECSLDGAATAPCTSPTTIGPVSPGNHFYFVRARDAAGNLDPSAASRGWLVDTVAPDTTIQAGPTGTVASVDATFAFAATESGSTFECALDGAPFVACTSPKDYLGLAQGPHVFQARATDPAGNVDATPAGRGWTVDTVAPETTFTSTPTDPTTDPTGDFAFESSEAGSTFRCSLDAAAFAPCASPFTTPALANGAHALAVEATDAVGNVEPAPATFAWTIVVDVVFAHGFED
jgi:large repetitive protein